MPIKGRPRDDWGWLTFETCEPPLHLPRPLEIAPLDDAVSLLVLSNQDESFERQVCKDARSAIKSPA